MLKCKKSRWLHAWTATVTLSIPSEATERVRQTADGLTRASLKDTQTDEEEVVYEKAQDHIHAAGCPGSTRGGQAAIVEG